MIDRFKTQRTTARAMQFTTGVMAAIFLLSGCANSNETGNNPGMNDGASEPASSEAQQRPDYPNPGVETSNEDIRLTVTSFKESKTREMDEEGRMKGYGEIVDESPKNAGAKFVSVETKIFNDGSQPWDLTCGTSVAANLYDAQANRYPPITELYRVPDNPSCNELLAHGFERKMTWVFEVPEKFSMDYATFGYYNGESTNPEETFIENEPSK